MAFLTASTAHSSPLHWLDTLRTRLATALARRAQYRTTVRELQALSDRELADIGLHRSMIRSVARTHADTL